jgi:hypothetical protein
MASFGAAGEVVFLLRGFLLLDRGMLELAVLEAEIERSHIKVNREVGVRLRLLDRRRDLLVRCSPVPPLPSLLPFRPRPSICSPSPPLSPHSPPLLCSQAIAPNAAALLELAAVVRVSEPFPWTMG